MTQGAGARGRLGLPLLLLALAGLGISGYLSIVRLSGVTVTTARLVSLRLP